MKTQNIPVTDTGQRTSINLGHQGEHLATEIIFDCTLFRERYGEGRALLLHQRSRDAQPYPVAAEQNGDSLRWLVNNGDTAHKGVGKAELQWYVGESLAKSAVWQTSVAAALEAPSDQPPDPVKPWYNHLMGQISTLGGVKPEDVQNAVNDYLEAHPVGAVDVVEEGNMAPITSNAVYALAGNVEALMGTI